MKRVISAAAAGLMLVLSSSANAALLFSVQAEVQHWMPEAKGSFGELIYRQEFNFKDESAQRLAISFDHPLPLIPNVRYERQGLDTSGTGTATSNFSFGGQLYSNGTAMGSDLDLSHDSLTFYYRFLDNSLVRLHAGITAKMFDGEANMFVTGGNQMGASSSRTIDETVPLLYVNASVGLPFSGLSVYARGHALALDDNKIQDLEAGIRYRALDLGIIDANITAGYRTFSIELDDLSGFYSDLDFSGPFIAVSLHF